MNDSGRVFQLIYRSQADESLCYSDIERILRLSVEHNRQVGVTGVLLYRDGAFLQLLEGPRRAVFETFSRASRDTCHRLVQVVAERFAEDRMCSPWAMNFQDGDLCSAPCHGIFESLFACASSMKPNEDHLFFFLTEVAHQMKEQIQPGITKERQSH